MWLAQAAQINALPIEILSWIFTILIDASFFARSTGDTSYDSIDYPTLLSSVCVHWRRVTIHNRQLWAYVKLSCMGKPLRDTARVELGLERSQNSPLRVRVSLVDGTTRGIEHLSPSFPKNQIIPIIHDCAPRIQSFILRYRRPGCATEMLSALLPEQGDHPVRELAVLQRPSSRLQRSPFVPPANWDRLLNPLHALHLEMAHMRLNTIPCRKLVELRLTYSFRSLSLAELIQLLESNTGLHSIVLNGLGRATIPSPSEIPSITLPSLRSVQLSMKRQIVIWFLKLLVPGPHQLDLYLKCIGQLAPDDVGLEESIISLSQRTHVRSFLLRTKNITLPPILKSLSHLQILRLNASTLR